MPFVLDASVTVSWGLEGEAQPVADLALERLDVDVANVPALWWFEVRNVLLMNERRKRIVARDTETFLQALSKMNIQIDGAPAESTVLGLARAHRITVYDAAYLELALRKSLPLATLDRQIAAAARNEGVPLFT